MATFEKVGGPDNGIPQVGESSENLQHKEGENPFTNKMFRDAYDVAKEGNNGAKLWLEEDKPKEENGKSSEIDGEFFKAFVDISHRVDVDPGEYAFVGHSAQKDFDTLKELESRISMASEENKEKYRETVNYLKNKINNNFDVE